MLVIIFICSFFCTIGYASTAVTNVDANAEDSTAIGVVNGNVYINETSEEDDIRDSLSEYRKMPLPQRQEIEQDMKRLYQDALKTGNTLLIESKAIEEQNPFAQIYWCALTVTPESISSRAEDFFLRGARFFGNDIKKNPKEKSGVFSFLCGILNEYTTGKKEAKSHYFKASDKFKDDEAQFRLAEILYENREFKEALKYYEASANQQNIRAIQRLQYIANTNIDVAVDAFRLSCALRCEREEKYEEAIHLYKICIRKPFIEPITENLIKIMYRLAKIHEQNGILKESSEYYYDIISYQYPSTTVVDIYSRTNQNVLDDIDRLCEQRNGYALFYRGKVYGELIGEQSALEMALDFYSRANEAEKKPSGSDLQYFQARAYKNLLKYSEATELYFNLALQDIYPALTDIEDLCAQNIGFAQFYRAKLHVHKANFLEASGDLESANSFLFKAIKIFSKAKKNEPLITIDASNELRKTIEYKDILLGRINFQNESKKALRSRFDKSMNTSVSNTMQISSAALFE